MKIRQLTIRNRHDQLEVVATAHRGRNASIIMHVRDRSRSEFGYSIVLTPAKARQLADWLQKWQKEARKKDG